MWRPRKKNRPAVIRWAWRGRVRGRRFVWRVVGRVRCLPPFVADLPARLRAGPRTFADAGADLGYFGDPARATAEEGHAMLDALADIIIGAIPWH